MTLESTATEPPDAAASDDERPRAPAGDERAGAYGRGGSMVLVGLAVLAAIASLATRGVGTALPGVWVGMEAYITAMKMAAALSSQLFAVASSAVVIGLVMVTVKGDKPAYLRAFSVGVGVLTILAVMIASAVPLPDASRLVLAFGVGTLAVMCSVLSAQLYTSRAPAIILALVAASGLLRILVIILAQVAFTRMSQLLADVARVMTTISVLLVTLAVLAALAWTARVPGRGGGTLRWGALTAMMAVLGVVIGLAQLGADPEAGGLPLLVARTLHEMGIRPRPFGPTLLYSAFEGLRWLAAVVVLVVAPRSRAMSAAVALSLLCGGMLEVPLCAASMVVASLALAIHPPPAIEDLEGDRRVAPAEHPTR